MPTLMPAGYRYDWDFIVLERGKEAVYWFWLDENAPKIMIILEADGEVEIVEQWFEEGPYHDDRPTHWCRFRAPNNSHPYNSFRPSTLIFNFGRDRFVNVPN